MRAALVLTAALLVAGALTGSTAAVDARARATSIALVQRADGTFVPRSNVGRFTLAGVQWQGLGRVQFRTRSTAGRWSAWRPGSPEGSDGPDPTAQEGRRSRWRLGNPWWVGASDRIEARTQGRVEGVRAELVWSPEAHTTYRTLATTDLPAIVSRSGWGADETIRRNGPTYASAIRFVVVHHTAGTNGYTRAEAPAIVRGIELYHVRSNGWNDIGYNFLVDRFGTIYEGRYGGVDRNVVGAHALGFNSGSVGIAVLGSYGNAAPSRAAQDAVARLIAWRLDLAHVDPTSSVSVVSGGSERFPSGRAVQLRVVSGHRDTGSTECPGDQLYARLDAIAAQARALGGPKIFEPLVETSGPLVRFRARLSAALPWTVSVTGAGGAEVASGSGVGGAIDWTWDSTTTPAGAYSWMISAGVARPATGMLRAGTAATPFAIEDAGVEPATISPNGDGQADTAVLGYRLTGPAAVTVQVLDAAGVAAVTLLSAAPTSPGRHTVPVAGDLLPDGHYDVVLTATPSTGDPLVATLPLIVSRTLGLVTVSPTALSPNGDGRNDELEIGFALSAPATARVRIEREGRWVASLLAADLPNGPQTVQWDGTRSTGRLRDGSYSAIVEITDAVGINSVGVPFTVDTAAPRVRILSGRGIRIEVDEPAELALHVDGIPLRRIVHRAGVIRIRWPEGYRRVGVVATDAAGNRSAPVVSVRRKVREVGQ